MLTHSQKQEQEESSVFRAFLELQPGFAGEPLKEWQVMPSDPPDISCITESGKRVGVELGECVNPQELSASKKQQNIEAKLMKAIGEQPPLNQYQHFSMVFLYPLTTVPLDTDSKRAAFRQALFRCLKDVDGCWQNEGYWPRNGCTINNLTQWQPLGKYLEKVQFVPGKEKYCEGIDWILLPGTMDSFDANSMTGPFIELIEGKLSKYQAKPIVAEFDELILIAYFDQGVISVSPVATPQRPLLILVEELKQRFKNNRHPFKSAFLFFAPSPGERVFKLW